MILKGSQRGGARQLADHLMNLRDNDHVELHSIKGFIAEDLHGALQEAHAISRATRAKQFMFSLSLSPPKDALVTTTDFENAIEQAAQKLGLGNQPRIVVFHEKSARRHCHVVFSRIDAHALKAINLPFFKARLTEVSRELYLTHGWDMPRGLADKSLANPLNFKLEEWQIAQRAKFDPREIKATLKQCWSCADTKGSFEALLKESGFWLCRGDRRSFVVVDYKGNLYSLSRWLGAKPKELTARLGTSNDHRTIDEAKALIGGILNKSVEQALQEIEFRHTEKMRPLLGRYERVVTDQRQERTELARRQQENRTAEAVIQAKRFRKGLLGIFDWVTGKRRKISQEIAAQQEIVKLREIAEAETMQRRHRREIEPLKVRMNKLRNHASTERQHLIGAVTQSSPTLESSFAMRGMPSIEAHYSVDLEH